MEPGKLRLEENQNPTTCRIWLGLNEMTRIAASWDEHLDSKKTGADLAF